MDAKTVHKTKKLATDARERVQESSLRTAEGFRDFQLKILAATQENIIGMFEYIQDVVKARSVPELFQISTAHSQQQLSRMTEQAQEIAGASRHMASARAWPFTRAVDTST
jgi:hypothetical protein